MSKLKIGEQARAWINFRRESCIILDINLPEVKILTTSSMSPDSYETSVVGIDQIVRSNILNKDQIKEV